MTQNEKASSHLRFAGMLLSVACRKIKSELTPYISSGGVRRVVLHLEIELGEDQYQLCRDLAFAQLLDSAAKNKKDKNQGKNRKNKEDKR